MKKIVAFTLMIGMFTACGDFGDMNDDPNIAISVPSGTLVTQGQFSLINLYWGRTLNFELGMLMVQHFAQAEYTEESNYNLNSTDFDFPWNTFYAGGMSDLMAARELVIADENVSEAQRANQLAVIDILTSFGFQFASDLWGDIPMTEAFKPEEFVQPSYDSQSQLYADLISKTSAAVNSISVADPGFGASDVMFSGDMDKWQKFGNALLLRMAMRISDVNSSLASSTASAALSGNIISSVADEAAFVFDAGNQALSNPFYIDAVPNNRDDFRVTEELLDMMQPFNDPRVAMFCDPTPTNDYVGMPYGLNDGDAFNLKPTTSRFAASIRAAGAPATVLRYSEVKLLEAEAIEAGYVAGNAATAYAEAVEASMNEWGITDATAISDYLAAKPYVDETSIHEQMYIALYTNGLEGWAHQRRTDIPALTPGPAALTSFVPVRGFYPTDEQATNKESLDAVPYEDKLDTKLWWDVN